jgi:hypothetical protein
MHSCFCLLVTNWVATTYQTNETTAVSEKRPLKSNKKHAPALRENGGALPYRYRYIHLLRCNAQLLFVTGLGCYQSTETAMASK